MGIVDKADAGREAVDGAVYDVALTDVFGEWVEDGVDLGLRPASVENRRVWVGTALVLLQAQGVTSTAQVGMPAIKAAIRAYAARENPRTGRTPNDVSVRTWAIKFKCFTTWCWEQNYIKSEKFSGWKLPKSDAPHVRVWTDGQLETGYRCIQDYWDPAKHPEIADTWSRDEAAKYRTRITAIFCLAVSAGLRRGEIVGLTGDDWNRVARTLTVRQSKGRSHREIPVGPTAAAAIEAMLETRAVQGSGGKGKRNNKEKRNNTSSEEKIRVVKPTGFLFKNGFGEQLDGPSTLRQMQRYFAWGRAQGMDLPEKFTIHALRHKAISAMLQVNPEHARLVAGHKFILTTQKTYGHTVTEDVRQTHAQSDVLE